MAITLTGVLLFKEWKTTTVILLGSWAVLLIIGDVLLTVWGKHKETGEQHHRGKGL